MQGLSSASTTYLDTLSVEEVWNIVRHLSQSPRRRDWTRFIAWEDLRLISSSSCAGSNALREHFKIVCISDGENYVPSRQSNIRAPEFTVKPEALTEILAVDGIMISALEVTNPKDIDELLPVASKGLLSLRLPPPYLLSSTVLDTLVENGAGLRSLSLTAPTLGRIQTQTVEFVTLWPVVGDSLESLEFDVNTTTFNNMLDGLQEHCRNLRRIHIEWVDEVVEVESSVSDHDDSFEALTNLYASFGPQLESINIDVLPIDFCKRIQNCCPNAEVHFIFFDEESIAPMLALGPRISCLKFEDDLNELQNHVESLKDAAESCSNLRSIEVSTCVKDQDDFVLAALLERPKDKLEELRLQPPFRASILHDIAVCSCSLKSLSCYIALPERKLVEELVQKNSKLEDVCITIGMLTEDALRADWDATANELLPPFALCKHLRELTLKRVAVPDTIDDVEYIRYSEVIANTCVGFRTRTIYIEIWGTVYLQ